MQKQSMMANLKSLAAAHADLTWIKHLTGDPQTSQHTPNKTSRQVYSGHYVYVRPTPLPNPTLIHVSQPLLLDLGLTETQVTSDPNFLQHFTGDIPIPSTNSACWGTTWATPYALSIYGQEMYDNCPFKNGNGYGDGRAISVGEIGPLPWNNQRYEFQLKGAGTTPFCRGGDGRAVLRSSVREFLVSEAMHHLNISTTRALSLSVSQSETVRRPWYDPSASASSAAMQDIPDENDPRMARVPPEYRSLLIKQLIAQARNPTRMIEEKCAITCRVATSFLRVGHVELFSRRARSSDKKNSGKTDSNNELKELKEIVEHMRQREYSDVVEKEDYMTLLHHTSMRFAQLTTNWIRVGFCQGNFNSDNCLVGGRTMDYGPFGFMEKFEPLWNMWVGGGEHYGFLNQGAAGGKNFESLVTSFLPLMKSEEEKTQLLHLVAQHDLHVQKVMNEMWLFKLGLQINAAVSNSNSEEAIHNSSHSSHASDSSDSSDASDSIETLVKPLLSLMERSGADWTMLFRQLSVAVESFPTVSLEPFTNCFYTSTKEWDPSLRTEWIKWLTLWANSVQASHPDLASTGSKGSDSLKRVAMSMRSVNPKYVPREWMLVNAYTAAENGDYEPLKELELLFRQPYEEQSDLYESKYYRKTSLETYSGIGKGGTAFMS